MQVNIHDAKTSLSRLVERAARGEEVIIARDGVPVARLVPYKAPVLRFGLWSNLAPPPPDFFDPLSEDELELWEGGPR